MLIQLALRHQTKDVLSFSNPPKRSCLSRSAGSVARAATLWVRVPLHSLEALLLFFFLFHETEQKHMLEVITVCVCLSLFMSLSLSQNFPTLFLCLHVKTSSPNIFCVSLLGLARKHPGFGLPGSCPRLLEPSNPKKVAVKAKKKRSNS